MTNNLSFANEKDRRPMEKGDGGDMDDTQKMPNDDMENETHMPMTDDEDRNQTPTSTRM